MQGVRELEIAGVFLIPVPAHADARGWLVELWRSDWPGSAGPAPAMAYVSMTRPGVARGPHEHREQTDRLAFAGPSDFRVWLWENRAGHRQRRLDLRLGESAPGLLVVPPGVVHAYRNDGGRDGLVFNLPDRLYAGPGRADPVDEIRHEADPQTRFRLEG